MHIVKLKIKNNKYEKFHSPKFGAQLKLEAKLLISPSLPCLPHYTQILVQQMGIHKKQGSSKRSLSLLVKTYFNAMTKGLFFLKQSWSNNVDENSFSTLLKASTRTTGFDKVPLANTPNPIQYFEWLEIGEHFSTRGMADM